jgi:hypothetical protein
LVPDAESFADARQFLQDLLTQAQWREEVAFEGVQITGARIVGDVDLGDAKLNRPIEIKYAGLKV